MEDRLALNIIELAKNGDRAAIERLYRLHNRRIRSLCIRMSGSHTEAEDLTQETFLRAFEKLRTFRGNSAFSTWLYRVGINVVLMWIQKKARMDQPLDEVRSLRQGIMEAVPPANRRDPAGALIDRLSLRLALKQLPAAYKQVLILHDVHGYKHREIAQLTGWSVGNSKSQLHRARRRLRKLLTAR